MEQSDADLIAAVLRGDPASFEPLVVKYSPRVFATARRYARRESEIEAYDLVLRMIDNVLDLLGKQARIDGVENGSHARHREIHLEVAIRIPRERAYPGRWPDPQRRERIRQLPRSFMRVMVSVTMELSRGGSRDDLRVAVVGVSMANQCRYQ